MTGHIYRHHEPQLQVHTTGVYHVIPAPSTGGRLWSRHMNIKFMMESGDYGHRFTVVDGIRHE